MVYHSLLKGFDTFSELKTLIEIFLKVLSFLKHFPSIFCPYRLQPLLSHRKQSSFPFAILTEFDIDLDIFKEYEAFKFQIITCVESKMNLKSISVCTKSIKITAILVTFLRWLQYLWILYNYLSFCVRKSSLDLTKTEISMKFTFQTFGLKAFVY